MEVSLPLLMSSFPRNIIHYMGDPTHIPSITPRSVLHLLVLLCTLEQEIGSKLLVLVAQEESLEDHLALKAELLELRVSAVTAGRRNVLTLSTAAASS